jgi:two-component system cell cycle sensor histidine kinase/response regulator CckA
MSQSGSIPSLATEAVTKRLETVRRAYRFASIHTNIRGPLLTLGVAILFDTFARYGLVNPAPFTVMILTVLYAAISGGLRPATVSAVLTTLYALHYYSDRVTYLRYDAVGLAGLLSSAGSAWIVALVASRFMGGGAAPASAEMTHHDADVIRRRLSILEQVSAVLASSLDYESTLSRVARLLVPSYADWCTIHLMGEPGTFRFVAGGHRDPSRELVVRALGEYAGGRLPFDAPGEHADVSSVNDAMLRDRAEGAEQLKLYRALAPTRVMRVPIPVRGRIAGVLTLVMAESRRDFDPDQVEVAEELAGRATLAIENAMLHREATETDSRFHALFASHPQPMWIFDTESLGFLSVNAAAVRLYGYSAEEFKTMTILDLLPQDDTLLSIAPVEHGESRVDIAYARHRRKDGTIVEMELASQPLELDGRRARLVLGSDVSERTRALASLRQTEEQLRQAQRMDAMGRIGIGVAHDFNNVLTTIRGHGDLLLRDLATRDPSRASVERIVEATERGVLLTRQLISFGGSQPPHPVSVNVNAMVVGMDGLIRRLAGDDIEVQMHLAESLGNVLIDPAALEQALVSLILAAREAMPTGGMMTIETSERHMGGFPTGRHLPPGPYAVVAVGDTGGGPEPERPFQLQDRRGGEGLGLRVVSSIVRQSGGIVRVTSEPGEGRTVKIYLPLLDETPTSSKLGIRPRGNETVMVVEDEDGIRELVKRMLSDAGYATLEARHGKDALLTADRYAGPIDLLVTDVVMPGMGGGELARALTEKRPGLSVLYISGYADDKVLSSGVDRSEDSVLNKPFTGEDLLHRVRGLLDKVH